MAEVGKNIPKAKKILEDGGLVAIPTETVYGLAGNAFSDKAVSHIFAVKNRPSFDPLIVHCASIDRVYEIAALNKPHALQLAKVIWPGPLTMVLPKKENISDLVTSGMDSVAVRIPSHPLTLKLLHELSFPLVAPSANLFGYVSPTRPEHVLEGLGDRIDYILDGGPCELGIESTIISFLEDHPIVLRLGSLSLEKLQSIVGKVRVLNHSSSNPLAPGMLKSHYATTKKIVVGDITNLVKEFKNKKIAILYFDKREAMIKDFPYLILSESGDLEEAAANFFSALRSMDKMDINFILAEKVPDAGIGRAINDRLLRASA